jgi:hypothetical protein
MTTEYLNRVEPWSYPIPHYTEQAQVWHTRRFTSWLLRAGAEARFGTLLCSGSQAEARWSLLLEEQGVEVIKVSSTVDRPLPRLLTEHHGDHFNRRLFLVDGLDAVTDANMISDQERFWQTLDGQRSQVKQMATWVVFKISQPATLDAALRFAPRLMRDLDRVCWVWSPSERSKSTPFIDIPSSQHDHVYRSFVAASAYETLTDHLTLGRIFRSGYMKPSPGANERWRWGYNIWRGEMREATAARFGQHGVTESLSDSITSADALWALKGRSEAATPARKEQWHKRALTDPQAWQISSKSPVSFIGQPQELEHQYALFNRLIRWSDGEHPVPSIDDLKKIEILLPLMTDDLMLFRGQVTEWLTRAYAEHEEIDGCYRVNDHLVADQQVWPELRFIAHERLLDLALFRQDYTEARRQVDELEGLVLVLHTPLFQVRFLTSKARYLGALDPNKGALIQKEADTLNERFGGII